MPFCNYRIDGKCTKAECYLFGKECTPFHSSICEHKSSYFIENVMNEDRLKEIHNNAKRYGDI